MNSENKKWFDMMCEWNAKVYKVNPGCEEKIQRFHAALLLCGGSLYEAGEGICPFGL